MWIFENLTWISEISDSEPVELQSIRSRSSDGVERTDLTQKTSQPTLYAAVPSLLSPCFQSVQHDNKKLARLGDH